ncbi:DNA primase [Thalassospira xiamenensis M-5 = DSM 17429]|uniref:Zinc finger CHC2-type domain-containing protein n=1 Tax=Thalassospira xiamenensis M-5 = DSM 17429 TaxID=1123366 RepID=A0AB72UJM6_9PROT|nr:CHC2 zinc finger domain-containing protein [Thalassospira xiamenensis]AJD54384.1 hypothetical protein TH3_21558 [Thalassospira xiamenensis M-5 = DSM 17429]SIT21776.1 DNA primase [Thalassospira xiamenensis M-5 = DSM 17429]
MSARRNKRDDIDISEITSAVKARRNLSEVIVSLTGGKLRRRGSDRRHAMLCPFHKESTPSFFLKDGNTGDGTYNCFGCGAKGDLISFVKDYKSLSFREAIDYLVPGLWPERDRPASSKRVKVRRLSQVEKPDDKFVPVKWQAIVPVPEHASLYPTGFDRARGRSAPINNPVSEDRPVTQLPITLLHPYKDGRGQTYGYVIRADFEDAKITPFVQWGISEKGVEGWFISEFPMENRLPYKYEKFVEKLQAREDRLTPLIVLLVEGEKTCDHAAKFFPDLAVMTWPQGTKSVERVNWDYLAEADMVILSPDNDSGGYEAMARIALKAEAMRLQHIYCMAPVSADKGADLADVPLEDKKYASHLLKTSKPVREMLGDWMLEITGDAEFALGEVQESVAAGRSPHEADPCL